MSKEYCYSPEGCSGYVFIEECKNCHSEMDTLHEDGRNTYGTAYIYWCPSCGTILRWYDSYPIRDDDWMVPAK